MAEKKKAETKKNASKKIDPADVQKLIDFLKKRKKDDDEETTEITDHEFKEVKIALGKSELVKVIEEEINRVGTFNLENLTANDEDARKKTDKDENYKPTDYGDKEGFYSEKNDIYEEKGTPYDKPGYDPRKRGKTEEETMRRS